MWKRVPMRVAFGGRGIVKDRDASPLCLDYNKKMATYFDHFILMVYPMYILDYFLFPPM